MNKLAQLDQFEKVLAHYSISPKSKEILERTPLVLCAATTSSGRNTILREIIKTGDYHYVTSDTTRKPRINDGIAEQNGVEYWFKTENEFLEGLKRGEYLEAAIIHKQQVSGVSIKELQRAVKENKIPITDIEVQGVDNIVRMKPDTVCLFVLPPNFEEWQRRLKHRGFMPTAEYRRRLESAVDELKAALNEPYYYFVINDTVDNAIEHITALVGRNETPVYQQKARKLAQRILKQTEEHLRNLQKTENKKSY